MLTMSGINTNNKQSYTRKNQILLHKTLQQKMMGNFNHFPNYQVSSVYFKSIDSKTDKDKEKIKKLSLLLIKPETFEKIQAGKIDDPELKFFFTEMSKPDVAKKVIKKLDKAIAKALTKEQSSNTPDKKLLLHLKNSKTIFNGFELILNSNSPKPHYEVAFKGKEDDAEKTIKKVKDLADKADIKLGGVDEFVGETAHFAKPITHLAKGEFGKAANSASIRVIENTVALPAKKAVIGGAAMKGAALGSAFGPAGTLIGGIVGGGAAWFGWAKARNAIEDALNDD